jgi:putative lipoprotein
MKRQAFYFFSGAFMLLATVACSEHDDMTGDNSSTTATKTRIEVTADMGAGTRTLRPDAQNHIISEWAKGDKMVIYNIADENKSTEDNYSLVNIQNISSNKKQADFAGDVVSFKPVTTGNTLAFFYPGAAFEGEKTVVPVNPNTTHETDQGADLTYHDTASKIKNLVALNMKQQDGTLETIDKKFDYNWGKVTITSNNQFTNYTGERKNKTTILKTKVTLQRKVTFWGMKFTVNGGPSATGVLTDIDSIKVNGLRSYDVLDLQDGTFKGTSDEKEYVINIANKDRSKLNIKSDGYVWVAFMAEENASNPTNFTVTVYTQDGVFTKTASKKFENDYDYRTNITVEKVKPQPWVEVNGVKWATGNFIHYKKGSEEYWGIAPAQWWISNYGDNPSIDNRADNKNIKHEGLGSQNWFINDHTGRYSQTADDLDLFQWGVISDALKFNNVYYLQGTNFDMAGKYYKNRGGLVNVNETNNRSEATHGDIVRYYTEHGQKHYHYQYPSDADFNALFSANTSIPAYCYTDKGNKIYGAYFSDMKFAGSGSKFPTGRKIWKYQDVSGLVLANKGLFLPIGGRRPIRSAYVEFRHVANNSGFYGQYYTSKSPTYSIPHGVFFGAAFKMNIASPSKDQGSNIRPVYVGADNNDETKPLDAAKVHVFQNILTEAGRKY